MDEPARQAYSHSASLGKRYVLPAFFSAGSADSLSQNSTASVHDTFSTGKSLVFSPRTLSLPAAGPARLYFLPGLPVPSAEKKLGLKPRTALNCFCVTS